MNRGLILFIAYEACRGNDFGLLKHNPFQFRNAVRLISINISLYIIQLVIILGNRGLMTNGKVESVHYIAFMVGGIGIKFLADFILSKKVLAIAIKQYKGSIWAVQSKWIALGYLICNIVLLSLVWIWHY